jgi:hypothetical protein
MRVNAPSKGIRRGGGGASLLWTPQNDIDTYGGEWWDYRDIVDGAVSAWVSRDGTGQTVIQGTAGSRPVKSSSGVTFDGTDDSLSQAASANIVTHVNRANYPDDAATAAGPTPGVGGVPCGIQRVPGTTDQFYTMTYGANTTAGSDGGSRNPSMIKVRYPGGPGSVVTKLSEVVLKPLYPNISGMQDIAVDPDDGTLWAPVTEGSMAGQIIHFTADGTVLSSNMTFAATLGPVSGIAIVPANALSAGSAKRMWACQEAATGNNIECRSMVDNSVINAAASTGLSNQDGLVYDHPTRNLMLTYGANGSAGKFRVYGLTGASGGLVNMGDMTFSSEWDAIEQVIWEGRKFYGVLDRNYHVPPSTNNVLQEGIGVPPMSTALSIHMTASWSATTGTDCLIESGAPLGGNGFGVYNTSTTGISVFVNSGASGTSQQGSIVGTGLGSFASMRLIDVYLDALGSVGRLYVDGLLVQSSSNMANVLYSIANCGTFRVGTASDVRPASCVIKDIITVSGASNRVNMEGWRAWEHGLTANLPANHLWKNTRPTP